MKTTPSRTLRMVGYSDPTWHIDTRYERRKAQRALAKQKSKDI